MDIFRGTWRAGRTLKEMEGIDELDIKDMDRGIKYNRNFFSSIVAGMVTAGIWSAWNTFPMVTASRTITTGLAMGLTFGLGQDALRWVRMNKGVEMPKEESWLYRNARNKYKQVEEEASMEQK